MERRRGTETETVTKIERKNCRQRKRKIETDREETQREEYRGRTTQRLREA